TTSPSSRRGKPGHSDQIHRIWRLLQYRRATPSVTLWQPLETCPVVLLRRAPSACRSPQESQTGCASPECHQASATARTSRTVAARPRSAAGSSAGRMRQAIEVATEGLPRSDELALLPILHSPHAQCV